MSELKLIPQASLRGFTLVEMMVTMSVLAIMSALALPAFQTFMAENRARSKTVELAAAIKSTQLEATRRNRQVVFTLTSSIKPTTSLTGDAQGSSWASAALPLSGSSDSATPEVISVGGYADRTADVKLDASSAGLCFLPGGSLKANSSTGITSTACAVNSSTGANVLIYPSRGDKVWQVSVSPLGKISSCQGTAPSGSNFSCS